MIADDMDPFVLREDRSILSGIGYALPHRVEARRQLLACRASARDWLVGSFVDELQVQADIAAGALVVAAHQHGFDRFDNLDGLRLLADEAAAMLGVGALALVSRDEVQ